MPVTSDFREISVLEPDLRTLGSHHFEYVQLLRSATGRAGLSLRVFGHQDALPEVQSLSGATPVFDRVTASQVRLPNVWPLRRIPQLPVWLGVLRHNLLAERVITKIFRTLDWRQQLVLVPNCHQALNLALARCLRAPLRNHPDAGAVLVFPYYPVRRLFQQTFRALAPLVRAGRVALATDSEMLSELYQQLTGFPFRVLPMPYGADQDEETPSPARHQGTRFLVCGGYRMEKGIDLMADLVENQEPEINAGNLSFIFQGFDDGTNSEPIAARHFARIQAVAARCHPGSITIIDSALSSEDYHALFTRCDAAVLPYRSGPYGIRTSGVLTECFARAVPVVTTEGTWLGQQVKAHGAGLTFPDGDVQALVRAVRQMAAEMPRFTAEAAARREVWLAFHNPDHYLSMVTGLLKTNA